MKTKQAINIAKGCVMASFMDSETKQMVIESLSQMSIHKTETTSEPCGWCCGGDRFECYLIDDEGHTISINNNIVQTVIANYCPNCGRRL